MNLTKGFDSLELLKLSFFKGMNQLLMARILGSYADYASFLNSREYSKLINSNETLFGDFDAEFGNLAEEQLELCLKNNINIISISSPDYPELLKEINYPPALLFVQGSLESRAKRSVSIVGTRHYSNYGKLVTEEFAAYFASHGVIVVSGLAYGTDTAAHLACVKAGGATYAVIASGIDKLSPAYSVKNAGRIIDGGGAIISEYKCGVNANLGSFPQRNRIIAGISPATLVVESGEKGGSLITARMAFQSSREVYAIPGNINSPKSVGTHKLIIDNQASLAMSPEQIMVDLGFESKPKKQNREINFQFENKALQKIYEVITHEPIQVDSIPEMSGLDISEVLVKLLELEFQGFVRQLPGKHYVRIK